MKRSGFAVSNDSEQQNDQGGLYNFEDVSSRELGRHSLKIGGIFQHREVGFAIPSSPTHLSGNRNTPQQLTRPTPPPSCLEARCLM